MDTKTAVWAVAKRALAFSKHLRYFGWVDLAARRAAPLLIRAPTTETTFRTQEGFTLTVPPRFASAYSYRAGVYENETLAAITTALRSIEGGFVDAGANVGYFSIAAAKLAPERPVWAFEADPVIYKYLLCNLQQNGAGSVVGLQMAVADREGTSLFKSHRHGSEGSLVEANSGSTGGARSTPVGCTSLDRHFGQLGWPRIALVKLDIEGAELLALKGMRETIRRNPQARVIFELNPPALKRAGASAAELSAVLETLGLNHLTEVESGARISLTGASRSRATVNVLATGSTA